MRLNRGQTEKLLGELVIWVIEACDKCGQLLASVRCTRRDDSMLRAMKEAGPEVRWVVSQFARKTISSRLHT